VVVRDGDSRRQVDSGQYLLGLDLTLQDGVLQVVEHRHEPPAAAPAEARAHDWFAQALELESRDPEEALRAWQHAVEEDPHDAAAWTNWGRLLHERGRRPQAAEVYARALAAAGRDALLLFNQAVLLEDLGDPAAALAAYQSALEEDPDLADCHFNLARLYESMGLARHAIRHLGQYRRLLGSDGR
jgi:tetratricopeptide (TPR) repeat protein